MLFLSNASAWARPGLIVLALGAVSVAHAEPIQWSTGQVSIAFDPETFSFSKSTHDFGGVMQVDVSPLAVSYSPLGDGVSVNFQDQMSLYASSYGNFSPETLDGSFSAYFNFTPQAGFVITGYTVTYAGTYSIETPGSVYVGSTTAGPFAAGTGGGAFSMSASLTGEDAPALQGSFSATGDLTTIQVFDGYEQVLDHYETVLDYCDVEDPFTCYYREEPVYVGVPVYHDETDLGEASINLQSITLQAHVVAVPEPGALALALAGLPVWGVWWMRRRRVA